MVGWLGLWQALTPEGFNCILSACPRVWRGHPVGTVDLRGTTVKNPPARQEPQQTGLIPGSARSPEEGNGYPPSILTWRVPWTEEPSGLYSPWGCKESDTTEATWHACRAPSPKAKSFPGYYIPGLSGDRKEGSFGPEGQL